VRDVIVRYNNVVGYRSRGYNNNNNNNYYIIYNIISYLNYSNSLEMLPVSVIDCI